MDPFAQIIYKGVTYKTPTHEDGGKTPKWNHTFEIPIESEDDNILIQCFDEDLVSNTLIGEQSYRVSEILNGTSFAINFKGKKSGEIIMKSNLVPISQDEFHPYE